jgi:SAM-dependent methyltransferase
VSDSTLRFGNRVADYARYRPSYPAEAIEAVLAGFVSPQVADLGAGTGISARLLAAAGAQVYAVEPNPSMRSAIPSSAQIVVVDGTAESTNLPSHSVDVIAAFQAYHWFEASRVFAEAERIRRPRARFAAIWNERDESDGFVAAYSAIIRPYMADDTESRRRDSTISRDLRDHGWSDVRTLQFRHQHDLNWEQLIGRTRSASYLPREGPEYESMAAQLRELYERAADYGGARFVLVTNVHLGERQ